MLEALLSQLVLPAGELAFAQWSLESGVARPGRELTEDLNALEAGLREWIAWDKGCYIGQEVVARLDTYDKVRRRPAVVSALEPPPPPKTKLFLEGAPTGWILSSVARVDRPGTVGMAVVGVETDEGAALTCESGADWKLERFAGT